MKYVLSSWKMYPTVDQAQASFEAIQAGLDERAQRDLALPQVILCPPFLSLVLFAAAVDRRLLALGAQNCHWEAEGPFTGEISPRMLQGLVDARQCRIRVTQDQKRLGSTPTLVLPA